MTGRIAAVESVAVDGGFRNLVFVRVRTDEGLVGVGEATLEWHDGPVRAAVAALGEAIAGQEASRIEHLWQLMFRGAFWRGGPVHLTALSAIDQALWDIKGKAAGMPVYDLLGGRCRDTLELYANGPLGSDPDSYAEAAAALVARGYRAMKVCPVPPIAIVDGDAVVRSVAAAVAAIREAIGPDVKLAVDLHGRTSPAMSIRLAEALAPFGIWFLEEPALPDNRAGYARVAQATTIPLAGGERWLTRAEFRDLDAVALVQPDVAHCGGISETRRIAAMAEFAQVGYAPHNPLGPVGTIASAHVALASPNFVVLERLEGAEAPDLDDLVSGRWSVGDGVLHPSGEPGLGIELDWEACQARPARPKPLPGLTHADGSVAEW